MQNEYINFSPNSGVGKDKKDAAVRDRKAKETIDARSILVMAAKCEGRKKANDMSYAFQRAAEIALINQGVNPNPIRNIVLSSFKRKKKQKPETPLISEYKAFKADKGWIPQADGSFIKISETGLVTTKPAEFWDRGSENVQEHHFNEAVIYDNFVKRVMDHEVRCG